MITNYNQRAKITPIILDVAVIDTGKDCPQKGHFFYSQKD